MRNIPETCLPSLTPLIFQPLNEIKGVADIRAVFPCTDETVRYQCLVEFTARFRLLIVGHIESLVLDGFFGGFG